MKKIEDLTGKTIGIHLFKEICKDSIGTGKIWWMVECTNCKTISRRRKDYKPGCVNCYSLPKGYTGLTVLMSRYRLSCKDKSFSFELNREQFRDLTSTDCHYCGVEPKKPVGRENGSSWGEYFYNGIDRKDNNLGYIYSNCLSCCTMCNIMKSDMSYCEFIAWIDRIVKKRNKVQNTI